MLSLDARLCMTFPKEGFYYVEVHDARFSTQAQDFYRLKTGAPMSSLPRSFRWADAR